MKSQVDFYQYSRLTPKTAQGLRGWFLSREAEERGMLFAFRLTTTTRGGNHTAKACWFGG